MRNLKDLDLVSVIIPYYKSKKFIKKSVKSVLNQTFRNHNNLRWKYKKKS